nr:MAG TPA: hypothetical protein [Caudoviricetes sp.]
MQIRISCALISSYTKSSANVILSTSCLISNSLPAIS